MRFFDKIRSSFASFMAGRYGADQLGMTMLWTALILSIVGSFSRLGLLTLMADALLLLVFWRMLSKDRLKRQHENQTYLQKTYGARKAVTEWFNRVKNGKPSPSRREPVKNAAPAPKAVKPAEEPAAEAAEAPAAE